MICRVEGFRGTHRGVVLKECSLFVGPHTRLLQWIVAVLSIHAYGTDSWVVLAKTLFVEAGILTTLFGLPSCSTSSLKVSTAACMGAMMMNFVWCCKEQLILMS